MPITTVSPPRFLSLPPETRNKIYRLVLCHPRAIGTWAKERRDWPNYPLILSAQLLRTCKQIHAEGVSILYGENTFEMSITNTAGPYYRSFYHPQALSCIYSARRRAVVQHLRRLSIEIRYTEEHKLELVRYTVRGLVENLRKSQNLRIEYLRLDCRLDLSGDDDINWRDPCWDRYDPEGNQEECVGVLRTWLGRLRDVKEVVIEGMPDEDAAILRERCQTRSEEEEAGLQTPPLTDLYEDLEESAGDSEVWKEELGLALLAVEMDDAEGFKASMAAILKGMKKQWEDLQNKESLWQFAQVTP